MRLQKSDKVASVSVVKIEDKLPEESADEAKVEPKDDNKKEAPKFKINYYKDENKSNG
jgi:hypothetical protein